MNSSGFQSLWKRMPLFWYCTSEPVMSVTLAVAIISLLLAAVGFHSHKDSVQWQFAGERKESKSEEKIHHVEWQCAKLNSELWGLLCGSCTWLYFSQQSPNHTRRKACRLTCIVLRESGEQEEKEKNKLQAVDTHFEKVSYLEVRRKGQDSCTWAAS